MVASELGAHHILLAARTGTNWPQATILTELPYNDGMPDVHSDTANLSENIIAVLFEDETRNLKAGIHLHWALPDALTRGTHSLDGTDFPAAPNSWL